jgi:ribose transport system ATP-binding protein
VKQGVETTVPMCVSTEAGGGITPPPAEAVRGAVQGGRPAPDVEVSDLKKAFGANRVLKGINLTIRGGEFVGLMGPNGAGKSTLLKILAGVYSATSGEIRLGAESVTSLAGNPAVGFIHQDLGLAEGLTIAENMSLGAPLKKLLGPILNKRAERDEATRALRRVGLDRDVNTMLRELTAGEKALVAIARLFDRGAQILIVDETTSTLSATEANRLISSLATAVENGATVVMVSHKLHEILDATERVVVLVDGAIVADEPTKGLDRAALVEMLMQQESSGPIPTGSAAEGPTEGLIELRDVQVGKLDPINLTLHAGEIVGISGLVGSGLHDIAYAVNGNLKPKHGHVLLLRPDLKRALVPPHRETQGCFGALTVRENMAIAALPRWRSLGSVLNRRRERLDCEKIMRELSVQPPSLDQPFDVLSGGNKQKVIFGRALLRHPDVYILCEPTRGVDVATRSEIYRLIRGLAKDGAAVLVASSDAEDLLSVCDKSANIVGSTLRPFRHTAELDVSEMELMV